MQNSLEASILLNLVVNVLQVPRYMVVPIWKSLNITGYVHTRYYVYSYVQIGTVSYGKVLLYILYHMEKSYDIYPMEKSNRR
eukprot:SAG11_NODE_11742_length_740_cov_1.324493_1_plen_82_part_00